jgi:hypothetical protein
MKINDQEGNMPPSLRFPPMARFHLPARTGQPTAGDLKAEWVGRRMATLARYRRANVAQTRRNAGTALTPFTSPHG